MKPKFNSGDRVVWEDQDYPGECDRGVVVDHDDQTYSGEYSFCFFENSECFYWVQWDSDGEIKHAHEEELSLESSGHFVVATRGLDGSTHLFRVTDMENFEAARTEVKSAMEDCGLGTNVVLALVNRVNQ